jgi:hypothetical protein
MPGTLLGTYVIRIYMHDKQPVEKQKEEENGCTGLTMRMCHAKDRVPRRKRRSTVWWSEWRRLDWTERKIGWFNSHEDGESRLCPE